MRTPQSTHSQRSGIREERHISGGASTCDLWLRLAVAPRYLQLCTCCDRQRAQSSVNCICIICICICAAHTGRAGSTGCPSHNGASRWASRAAARCPAGGGLQYSKSTCAAPGASAKIVNPQSKRTTTIQMWPHTRSCTLPQCGTPRAKIYGSTSRESDVIL